VTAAPSAADAGPQRQRFRIGVRIPGAGPLRDIVATVQRAERAGLDMAWFADSPLNFRELWTVLGACAASSERITLGSAVTNLASRHLTVTAAAAATLGEALPGRFQLGLGAGDSAIGYDGLKLATVAQLEQGLRDLKALLGGGAVRYGDFRATLRYADVAPPVMLAASGPRVMQLAGKLADGVIITMGETERKLAAIRAGAAEAGREAPPVYVMAPCSVSEPGPATLRMVKHFCAVTARREGAAAFERAGFRLDPEFHAEQPGATSDIAHAQSVADAGDALDSRIPDELAHWYMRERTLIGSEAELLERFDRLEKSGVAGVYLTATESSALPDELIEALSSLCCASAARSMGSAHPTSQ